MYSKRNLKNKNPMIYKKMFQSENHPFSSSGGFPGSVICGLAISSDIVKDNIT